MQDPCIPFLQRSQQMTSELDSIRAELAETRRLADQRAAESQAQLAEVRRLSEERAARQHQTVMDLIASMSAVATSMGLTFQMPTVDPMLFGAAHTGESSHHVQQPHQDDAAAHVDGDADADHGVDQTPDLGE